MQRLKFKVFVEDRNQLQVSGCKLPVIVEVSMIVLDVL